MKEHISELEKCANGLAQAGQEILTESKHNAGKLVPVHSSFNIIGSTRCFTMDEVKSVLLAEEISRKRETKAEESTKRTTFNASNSSERGNGNYRGQWRGRRYYKGNGNRGRDNFQNFVPLLKCYIEYFVFL